MDAPSSSDRSPYVTRRQPRLPLARSGHCEHPLDSGLIHLRIFSTLLLLSHVFSVSVLRSPQNPSESVLFTEHKAAVSAAVFSPSGYWVASGDVEGNVIVWSYPQLKVKSTFQIAKSISDLDWDADSTRIVAGGDGAQKARVFSWDSGNNLGEITMHSHPVISVSYRKVRPYRIATGSEDLSVNIYQGPPFKYAQTYKGHSRYPNGVRYSPDGARFASVGADSKIVLFDGSTGDVVKESEATVADAHKGAIYAFAWSPDSKQILTASADKTAKIWDADTLTVVQTFTFGADTLDQQVGALWCGEYLVTVSLSGAINYLDLANPSQPKRVLHGHQTSIQSIALDRTTGSFYTAGLSGEVARWDIATGDAKWLTGKGHGGKTITNVLVTRDAQSLLTFGMDDKVRVSSIADGAISADAGELGGLPVAAAASPTDAAVSVAVLAQEKLVLLRGTNVVATLALGYAPTAVQFRPDGAAVLVGGKNKKVTVYEIAGDAIKPAAATTTISIHDKPLTSIRFSPDSSLLASTDQEASIYLHDVSGGAQTLKNRSGWRFHQAAVKDADFSPDSSKLVTSSLDAHIILWRDLKEFQAASRTRINDAHIDGANFVRFIDDASIISVGGDRAIKIFDL